MTFFGRLRRTCHSTAGFSLLEMVVAVAVLALVAAMVMPLLAGPSDGLNLQASARNLLTALRATRAAAMAGNTEVALMIDVERRTFESPVFPRRSLGPGVAAKITFAAPLRDKAFEGGFQFFADGSSTGGDVRLEINGRTAKVCVDWFTGAARNC